jgi:hypothetical protein
MTNDPLERRYRQLLLAYPRAYRQEREAELLDTLLELSPPGQHRPSPRQSAALLLAGLQVRVNGEPGRHSPRHFWLGALRTAFLLLLAGQCVIAVRTLGYTAPVTAVPELLLGAGTVIATAVAVAAVAASRYRLAIPLALAASVLTQLSLATTLAGGVLQHPVSTVLAVLLPTVLIVPLLRSPVPAGRWHWQVAVPLLAVGLPVTSGLLLSRLPAGVGVAIPVLTLAMLALCLVWGRLVDPRAPISLGLLILAAMAFFAITALAAPVPDLAQTLPAVAVGVVVGLVLLAAGGRQAYRHARL